MINPMISRNKAFIAILIVLILVSGSILLYGGQGNGPVVKWSNQDITQIVLPNSKTSVNVVFRSKVNLNNVNVYVVPALKNNVSTSPTQFSQIMANKDYQLTLNFTGSPISGLKFEGTIHLKDNMGQATTAVPLKVTVVTFSQSVPPDPGEAGKATLEGIDSDKDGVRDDLQRWIVLNYLNSEKRRAALTQYVKISELFLIDANDKDLSRLHDQDMERAAECGNYVFGLHEAIKARDEFRAQLLNNDIRSRSYITADHQLGGTFGLGIKESERKYQCQFNPDEMAN